MNHTPPRWLDWAREIEAISQTGLHYSQNDYDLKRYKRLLEISADIIANYSALDRDQIMGMYLSQKGYATPKVDVRAAVFKDGKLLMVKESADNGWTMPGGWADVGDVPSEAAERETQEEAGFCVKSRRLVGIYDANRTGPLDVFHAYKIIFLCDLVGGEATTSSETSAVDFFGPGEIPPRLSGERTRPRHIADAFAVLADPDRPVVFD